MTFVDSTAFDGNTTQPEVNDFIANALVTGSAFASALTSLPTSKGSVAFPTASPSGFDWTAEGAQLPAVDPGSSGPLVVVRKLAGLLQLTNELIGDNEIPVATLLAQAVQDSMSAELDQGLLYGDGSPPNPDGIYDAAPSLVGADLRTAVISAWGELLGAGAMPEQVKAFVHPTDAAEELGRTDDNGRPIHDDGDALQLGPVPLVPVAMLQPGDALVADVSRTYVVRRSDFRVDINPNGPAFDYDAVGVRITGRFAIGCPTPQKALRAVAVQST